MSHSVTTAPLKDAVPPGASLAYNLAAAHGARVGEAAQAAPATCALLRPAARREMPAVPPCAIAGEGLGACFSPVRPEPVEGQVPHPCAAPGASTGSARTGEGGDAAPQGHAPFGAALAAGVAGLAGVASAVGAAGTAATAATAATAGTGGVADVVAGGAGAGVVAGAAAGSGATVNTSDISGSADPEVDAGAATTTAPATATGPAALRCAIAHCGGQSALASAIGLSQSHVWNWLNRRSIPAEHCPAIERATNRVVRCEALRPDVDWAYLRAVCEELASVRDEA